MEIITSKATVNKLIADAVPAHSIGLNNFVAAIQSSVLHKKIRFPLLEHAADTIFKTLPDKEHIPFLDKTIALHELGGNVLAGKILQNRLPQYFNQSIDKAVEYIVAGNQWYVCDIIGERVLGYALLTSPKSTLPVLQNFAAHPDKWIVRSIGVAGHYAVKKGLQKQYVDALFQLLLSLAGTTDFHTKKGIGWAAKTCAKFHPEIIEQYRDKIDAGTTRQWFRTKVKIGLGRTDKYAKRHTG
ncbi:MAG: DNA alkylation repair protein [Flavipsychrobacter sp.]|nr:DNA alkylation repair protein [Flavipsychrobacter sp.]